MKITKIIQLADMIAPNKLPNEIKVHYLNEVEGVVATEVLMLSTADVPVYTADDIDIEMLVKPPHDKLYLDYLVAMIHFANGEYNKYANTFEKYNESLKEYHRFVFNTVCPANGGAVKELYYVSAYAIAVAHGYKGTEEEFGEMLVSGGGSGSGLGMTLLWENAAWNTYIEFEPQTLTVDAGYTKYLVQVVTHTAISYMLMQRSDSQIGYYDDYVDGEYVMLPMYGNFTAVMPGSSSSVCFRTFRLSANDDASITVETGYKLGADSATLDNTVCVPWRIYGIK